MPSRSSPRTTWWWSNSKISPLEAQAMIDVIRERTDRPVRYLVNTHWHDDHVWGNQSFAAAYPELEILAHRHTRDGILTRAAPALEGQIERLGQKIDEREAVLAAGVDTDGKPLTEES